MNKHYSIELVFDDTWGAYGNELISSPNIKYNAKRKIESLSKLISIIALVGIAMFVLFNFFSGDEKIEIRDRVCYIQIELQSDLTGHFIDVMKKLYRVSRSNNGKIDKINLKYKLESCYTSQILEVIFDAQDIQRISSLENDEKVLFLMDEYAFTHFKTCGGLPLNSSVNYSPAN